MKKKTILKITVLVAILAGSFIMLSSSGKPQPSACKESMGTCCKKRNNKSSQDGMIWDNLSGQFFSFTGTVD
ncbi:MAG: hypothetical protein ACHQEB_03675 [Chitinophagales bacterium]